MRLKTKPSTIAAAIAVAIGVLYIINANRGVTPYSWQSFGTFIVVGLFQTYRVAGVLSLMIALLIVQIIVVYLWGTEPRNRPLEDVNAATAPIPV